MSTNITREDVASVTLKEAQELLHVSRSQLMREAERLGMYEIGKRAKRIPLKNIWLYQRREDRRVKSA